MNVKTAKLRARNLFLPFRVALVKQDVRNARERT